MSAAEQLDTDHVIALGVRCERVNHWSPSRVYRGKVGQLSVSATVANGGVGLELSGNIDQFARASGYGATLEAAEAALEQELFARAKALVDVARATGLYTEVTREMPCGFVEECGHCDVCQEHQRQEAEHTYAELRGYR